MNNRLIFRMGSHRSAYSWYKLYTLKCNQNFRTGIFKSSTVNWVSLSPEGVKRYPKLIQPKQEYLKKQSTINIQPFQATNYDHLFPKEICLYILSSYAIYNTRLGTYIIS